MLDYIWLKHFGLDGQFKEVTIIIASLCLVGAHMHRNLVWNIGLWTYTYVLKSQTKDFFQGKKLCIKSSMFSP